jgi:hypothetical protein
VSSIPLSPLGSATEEEEDKKKRRRKKKEGKTRKRKREPVANRYPFSTDWYPTAQIFSIFLRISNGPKSLEGPSLHGT